MGRGGGKAKMGSLLLISPPTPSPSLIPCPPFQSLSQQCHGSPLHPWGSGRTMAAIPAVTSPSCASARNLVFQSSLKKEEEISACKDTVTFTGVPGFIQSTFWAPGNIRCRKGQDL